jgi:tetratricopeptide (TPR) repeat protein
MTLAHCAASLEACWELSKSSDASDLALAFKSVSKCLPILETIARNASQYQQEALHLAIQYALVKTILGWHCASSTATIQYAQDAVVLSKEADDISFQLSAYSKLAWAYFYAKKYLPALATAQEAEALLQQHLQQLNVQPLPSCIQNGIYSTLAVIQAKNGKSSDVALGKATEVDPGNEVYAFMDFTQSTQLLEAGWAYCYQGNQIKTMETLKKRINPETLVPTIAQSEIGRLETINILTLSSLRAKDRDMGKTIHFWRAAIESAKALQSEWAFTEAVTNYQFMEIAYPGEARIAELRDLIVHWNDERTGGSNTR